MSLSDWQLIANTPKFQMKTVTFRAVFEALLPIWSGALIGYLVWKTYFLVKFPEWLIQFVINRGSTELLTSLLGSSAKSEHVLILTMYLMGSIPGALVFGSIAGIVAARWNHSRRLAYSSLIWPLCLSTTSFISLYPSLGVDLTRAEATWLQSLWERHAQHQELQLLMYSTFLIVLVISSRIYKRICA